MERKALVTSHSIDETFESCPRRFEFRHVYGVGARGESGYAADVGTGLHEGIQAWAMTALREGATEEDRKKAVDDGLYALMLHWPWVLEDIGIEEKRTAITQRSQDKAIDLFYSVVEDSWWNDWELAFDVNGRPCIEVPYRIKHTSLPTFLDHNGVERYLVSQGKIDFVLRHRKTGVYRVIDIKTTNKPVKTIDANWRFSGQGAGYAIALGAVLGLPWRETGVKVTYLACVFGSTTQPNHVIPLTYPFSPEDIEDKLHDDLSRKMRMIQYGKAGRWPRRAGACESFGSVCPFFSVCHRRDSGFIEDWLAFSTEHETSERIYDSAWTMEA